MAGEFVMGAKMLLKDSFSSPMNGIVRKSKEFEQTTKKAETAADKYRQKMQQLNGTIRENSGNMGWLKGAIGAVAGSMALMGAKRWLIDSNADMETYRNTLSVVLGSQKAAVEQLAWAEKFAAKTPFEIPQVVEATTRMQAYGINARKTLGIVGDMASVMGKDLMQAVEAVADAQTGELERLKEFGITKEMIVRRGNQLGVQTVNNQGQIVDQKAFNAALFAIMQERYRGGMEIQSRSWKGMLSNVSDFVGRVGRKLGTPLFDALGKQVQRLLVWFDKLESSGQLDRWISNVVTVARVMGNVFGFIFRVVGPFLPLILSMVAAYKAYHTTIMIITAVTKLWTITQAILNGVMLLNPIGLVVAGIMLLIGVGIMLIMNWKKIVAWLSTAWQWIKNTAVNTFNSLVAFFKKWGLLIIGVIVNPFGTLGVMLLKTILNGIKKIAPNLYNSVKDVFMKIRRLLPFSDAKEGPFKDLTLSGKMTMHTLANGVRQGQGEFHKAMSESFEGTTGKTSPIGNTGAAVVGTSRPSIVKKINIQNLVKELKIVAGDKDGKQLSDEFVNALYDLLKNASDILQNGDLGEVL